MNQRRPIKFVSTANKSFIHLPVLKDEVLELFKWDLPIQSFADLTLGGGGHFEILLQSCAAVEKVYAFDQDLQTLNRTKQRLSSTYPQAEWIHDNFEQIEKYVKEPLDRILIDLGVSSFQLDDESRGFSFRHNGPLDMRMNPHSGVSAAEYLAEVDEQDLADVLWKYGEERRSRALAARLVEARSQKALETTQDLVESFGFKLESRSSKGKHPLTRVFQAIRIQVNREMEVLETLLEKLPSLLSKNGRLAVITFHSLEDRAVKWGLRGKLKPINKKVICASREESRTNPRSRSAKLRVYEKLEG